MIWTNSTDSNKDDAGKDDAASARKWASDASKGVKKRVKKAQKKRGLWGGPKISDDPAFKSGVTPPNRTPKGLF